MRRFYYVSAQGSKVMHTLYARHLVEGQILTCGRRTVKGWNWILAKGRNQKMKHCKQCEARRENTTGDKTHG